MKFLCDQCKAKYQIADDKVAGKTVKMKCRKCGHLIEVRAAVTESVEGGDSHPPNTSPMATSLSRLDNPRPSRDALAGAFAKSVSADEPAGSRSIALSPGDEWYVAINGVPVGPVRIGEIRRKAATGGVTEESLCWQEGFEEWRPVRAVPELAEMVREAIAGGRVSLVPAGPESRPPAPPRPPLRQLSSPQIARVSAAPTAPVPMPPAPPRASAVSSMSLGGGGGSGGGGALSGGNVGAHGSGVPSNVVPLHARASLPTYSDDDQTVVGTANGPLAAAIAASAPASVPLSSPMSAPMSSGAATPHVAAYTAPVSVAPDPFAAPAPSVRTSPDGNPFAIAAPPPAGAADPLLSTTVVSQAPPAGFTSSTGPPVPSPLGSVGSVNAEAPRRAGPVLSAPLLVLLVIGVAFGVTAAIVLFFRPAPVVVTSTTPSASAPGPTATPSAPIAANDIPPPDSTDTAAPSDSTAASAGKGPRPTAGGTKAQPVTSASAPKAVDPSISALLNGSGSGPSAGNGSGSGGGGSALTQDQIESVVRQRSSQVKRKCWEQGGSSSKSNNTTVALTVSGGGTVSSATATGNDPTISHCIETAVKSWQFPPSSGSTTVNIPFHFLSQ